MTYTRDRNIMEVNGQQSLDIRPRLGERLISECDLYAKIYMVVKPVLKTISVKWPPHTLSDQTTFHFQGGLY